jgi:hypothetical protein
VIQRLSLEFGKHDACSKKEPVRKSLEENCRISKNVSTMNDTDERE